MTQEDKELLFKDLCARLPYGIKVLVDNKHWCDFDGRTPSEITFDNSYRLLFLGTKLGYVKPYLFPLSSMTDEMLEELNANGFFKYRDTIANVSHLESNGGISEEIYTYVDIENIFFLIEFFHSHHIDYRGLIEKGVAIDATGLNVY